MKFISDPVIDLQRACLRQKYDEVFEKVRAAIKQSQEHLALLDKMDAINTETKALISVNSGYSRDKRKAWREGLEQRQITQRDVLLRMVEREDHFVYSNGRKSEEGGAWYGKKGKEEGQADGADHEAGVLQGVNH